MTTTNKTVLTLGIVAVVLLIGAYAYRMHVQDSTPVYTDSTLPTSASDTSDAALDKDTAAIDAQLTGVSSDNDTVSQSIQAREGTQ